jgi:SAM-dependent methyltransferase
MTTTIKSFVSHVANRVRPFGASVVRSIRGPNGKDPDNPLLPPKEKVFIGGGDFIGIGNDFFNIFHTYGGLRSTDRVLDVGAGQGRMAIPLTRFLVPPGGYTGLEIVKHAVEWCQNAYRDYPNFTFLHADIFNQYYNKEGSQQACEYTFPFPADSFDFIFLTSVFTHMRPDDTRRYLTEISRCLKRGGRCVSTFFLLTPDSLRQIEEKNAGVPFQFNVFDICLTSNQTDPEAAIAYPEPLILEWHRANRLQIVGDIHHGKWAKTPNGLTFQDVVVAEKE